MTCLEWISLHAAFESFRAKAMRHGFCPDKLEEIGEELARQNPLPKKERYEDERNGEETDA